MEGDPPVKPEDDAESEVEQVPTLGGKPRRQGQWAPDRAASRLVRGDGERAGRLLCSPTLPYNAHRTRRVRKRDCAPPTGAPSRRSVSDANARPWAKANARVV